MPFPATKTILTIAVGLLLAACSDVEDDPQDATNPSTPGVIVETVEPGTLVPGLALTPRPGIVVDMATARRYEAEGDIEAAAEAYIAIGATESPESIDATLAAARLLMESDDYEDARTLLESLVQEQAGTPQGLTGVYLLGRAYSGLSMWQEALEQFDTYIAGGAAAAYAHLDRSAALVELERGFEAAQSAQAGLNLSVPASMVRAYLLAIAQAYERAGAFPEAIGSYEQLIAQGALAGDIALGLQRIASLKQVQGDPTYTVERDRLLTEYPRTFQALVALEETIAAGEPVHASVRGLILYRHNEYTEAEPHFRAQIDAFPGDSETAFAHYYVGAIVESRGELQEALGHYAQVDLLDPASFLADDALWWRARIHEDAGELEDAGFLFSRIVNEYPGSEFAADAAFRRGMLAYRADAFADAAALWAQDLALVTDSAARQRLQLWQAKALLRAGEDDAAAVVLEPLTIVNEDDYFGIRALGLSEGQHTHPPSTQEPGLDLAPAWDWVAAEQWLAAVNGGVALSRPWETDAGWIRASELWRVGHGGYGDLEVYDLIEDYSSEAGALYTLSRQLLDEGRIGMSARAGQRLLRVLDANPNEGLPKALMSLSYPAAFGPLVQRYADAEGISPLLMLAFVRQESFFDPRAVSPVGALGLTQLLPESAQVAASSLGISAEVPREQLLHADLSLRLGARFMAEQLDRFGGDVFVALAAYNGGPTAAERWAAAAGDDADLYLETIEFAETRRYVEIVAENYAIYRYLYGGEPEPNLPR